MPHKDPEARKAWHAARHAAHREEDNARASAYYADNLEAQRAYRRRYYLANRERVKAAAAAYYVAHREYQDGYAADRRKTFRDRIAAIKMAMGCVDCRYNAHPDVLEFDHLPGSEKLFNISMGWSRKWPVVEAEIAKCELVCANCHRVRTSGRRPARKSKI